MENNEPHVRDSVGYESETQYVLEVKIRALESDLAASREECDKLKVELDDLRLNGYAGSNTHREAQSEVARLKAELRTADAEQEEKRGEIAMLKVLAVESAMVIATAKAYLDAVETCHICEGIILVDSGPVHCEDCGFDCDLHGLPNCEQHDVLHSAAQRAILAYFAKEDADAQ